MMDKLMEDDQQSYHILLCCSGGMTTGYFAQKLNKYCQLNHLPYHIDATAIYELEMYIKNMISFLLHHN